MSLGPDFTQKTREILAKRAGQVCSNPNGRRRTSGQHTEDDKAINLGDRTAGSDVLPRFSSSTDDEAGGCECRQADRKRSVLHRDRLA
jgi:hypothetical protein